MVYTTSIGAARAAELYNQQHVTVILQSTTHVATTTTFPPVASIVVHSHPVVTVTPSKTTATFASTLRLLLKFFERNLFGGPTRLLNIGKCGPCPYLLWHIVEVGKPRQEDGGILLNWGNTCSGKGANPFGSGQGVDLKSNTGLSGSSEGMCFRSLMTWFS
ncbi:uncharacterized protein [Leptinotarsa decemlineata]|uniref:uncharacterized protein n=1 Tax=Leptinotarsa decemlineata TaxID=7539 RepID=UPI003D30C384